MTCNCPCTCPPQVGDAIRYKLDPDGYMPDVRINGALDLKLVYLGPKYAIYTWQNRRPDATPYEELMTREEFDEKIERVPGQ